MRSTAGYTVIFCSIILTVLFAGCSQNTGSCRTAAALDLSRADQYAQDEDLPFRFPMDNLNTNFKVDAAVFADHGMTTRGPENHAAEDYHKPAGTPVYAMTDGQISFSGPAGGYGWLIIIDHPQANLYSLYGHLSPSRWRLESGRVEKGDLIAYLGDSDENGGSRENPLVTHLHLGVRAGQRSDYPARGQWRWMAGWIKPCPQDLGWLQPSVVINDQVIPEGGFSASSGNFLEKWSVELVMGGIYMISSVFMFIFGMKKDKPYLLLFSGAVMLALGVYFFTQGWKLSYALYGMALILAGAGIFLLIRRFRDIRNSRV